MQKGLSPNAAIIYCANRDCPQMHSMRNGGSECGFCWVNSSLELGVLKLNSVFVIVYA